MNQAASGGYKPIFWWLICGCILIASMVVVGGITRLTHSGLSITEWKVITGTLPPLSQTAWQKEFDTYKLSPQFQKINYDMGLDEFKSIYWWEYIHRLLGRMIGIVFLVPFLFFYLRKMIPPGWTGKLLFVFVLGGFQGVLGWYMVKSGLVNNPHVSHYRLAAHLITALISFSYCLWLALEVRTIDHPGTSASGIPKSLLRLATLILFLIFVQLIYGAFVAGLRAGLVYNTFPKMGSQWIPDGIMSLQPWWKNFTESMSGVQFIHRYNAWLLFALCGWFWYRGRKSAVSRELQNLIQGLLAVLCIQFLLGVFTLVYAVPVILGVVHQLGAVALLTYGLLVNHRIRVLSGTS